jgi:hypothetical protein
MVHKDTFLAQKMCVKDKRAKTKNSRMQTRIPQIKTLARLEILGTIQMSMQMMEKNHRNAENKLALCKVFLLHFCKSLTMRKPQNV